MRRVLTAAAVVVGLLLPGSAAWADGFGRGGFHPGSGGFHHGGFNRGGFRPGSHDSFSFGLFLDGPAYYAPPPYYYYPPPPVTYYPPPAYYPPAAASSVQPLPGTVVREGRDSSGNYCREYQSTAYVNGEAVQTYGTACLRPDGTWQIVG